MKEALVIHRRLVAGGLSADQAKTFLRLLTDAEAGRFDPKAIAAEIAAADLSSAQAAILIVELLQTIARHAGGS